MYGPGYSVNNLFAGAQQAITTTYKSLTRILVPVSAGKRLVIWELDYSFNSNPNATDCQAQFDLMFCSAVGAGTTTAATPMGTDSNGGTATDVAVTTAGVNYTAEPTTFSATPAFVRAPNQRSPAFWQASPGGDLKWPATASTGPAARALSTTYTGNAVAMIRWSEV
jgi:hypothetical protein